MVNWSKNLETGIDIVDEQHKELVDQINNLLEATRDRRGKEEVTNMLEFLASYVVEHFKTEEKYMIKYDYPKYLEHKKDHDAFVEEVKKLFSAFVESGETVKMIVSLNGKVVKWLIDHIMKIDREMAIFFKDNNINFE